MSVQQEQTNVQDLERRASRIVLAIEQCMGLTRNIEAFNKISPAALWSAVGKASTSSNVLPVGSTVLSTSRQTVDPKTVIESFDLLAHLESKGFEAANVQILCGGKTTASFNSTNNPRRKIVQDILQPLAEALCDCYEQLDRIPAPTPLPPPQSQKTKKQPPPPPPGMLSLQNYTDIGAFLEFWVCTSVLPLLEPCILFPVEDRARYFLPKSLAGRLSRPSLLWGCRQEVLYKIESGKEWEELQAVVQELQSTVVLLGHILLLDRFRPMLLPRHLSDMYAAVFQMEVYTRRLQELSQQQQQQQEGGGSIGIIALTRKYQEIVALLLPPSITQSESNTKLVDKSMLAPVNPALQAQSLQTLLLQGIKAPLWLRQRVATRLTDLACHNLSVIIQVFVHAAPPKDKTAASLRLAHTLVTSTRGGTASKGSNVAKEQGRYYDQLCGQVVQIVDDVVNECHRGNLTCGCIEHLTLKQKLDVHTVWAILDHIPVEVMQSRLLSTWSKDLVGTASAKHDSVCIHRTINRIAILAVAMPPSFNPSKFAEVFLKPLTDKSDSSLEGVIKSTILGQLVRLAALPPTVIKSTFREDVVLTFGLVLQLIFGSTFNLDSKGTKMGATNAAIDGTEVAAMALLYAVAPSNWDVDGYSYIVKSETASHQLPGFVGVEITHQVQASAQTLEDVIAAVERRVTVVLEDVLSPIVQASSSSDDKSDDTPAVQRKAEALPSVVFHLVLRSYFVGAHPNVSMPRAFQQSASTSAVDMFRIVTMCFLPPLCENCPIDHLLKSSVNDATGIFGMMQLVYGCAGAYFTSDKMVFSEARHEISSKVAVVKPTDCHNVHPTFHRSGQYFSAVLEATISLDSEGTVKHEDIKTRGEVDMSLVNVELLLSVTTLLLSLLIAIVELGSHDTRSPEEELALESFVTLLRPLAELSDTSWMHHGEFDKALASSSAEMAEMAGHAMALLAARKAPSQSLDNDTMACEVSTPKETVEKVLQQAQMDLTSTQPPIRARGVVSLQRFLRGEFFQELLSNEATTAIKSPLIVELDESGKISPTESVSSYAINGILNCAISALSDSESYVYLAAVQSIVAAADACPLKVLPSIALAVASGNFGLREREVNKPAEKDALSSAQQIKLSEALIFCIRRRANLDEFAALILDLMIFGDEKVNNVDTSDMHSDYDKVLQMHKETQKYFLQGRLEDTNEYEDFEEQTERQSVRFNTGGPMFGAEERDVVTAGRIAVISELLSVAHPSTMAKYCHILVRAATETLQLDASRPVRRSAAFLAREIYQCVLKEQVDLFEVISSSVAMDNGRSETDLAFTSALVASTGDEVLASTLKRCLAGDDLNDLPKDKHRLFDSASIARSQEALDTRRQAVDGGVFVVAKLLVDAKRQRKKLPAAKFLQDLLKSGNQDETNIEALRSLKVNFDTLELS